MFMGGTTHTRMAWGIPLNSNLALYADTIFKGEPYSTTKKGVSSPQKCIADSYLSMKPARPGEGGDEHAAPLPELYHISVSIYTLIIW